ncbi:Ig-specific serine endopeptidase MIP [Mycoplasma putrefaciens]|uniref:Lipoprotein n=1 Tax=Mycoplasma putrefaciens (strain ATCC 15718 / NCTC 10155 / C30 KS-1 / KS-1) TaxID=743965 RepID=A0A7U3ZSF9_MYCPK|nr:DUF31 family protein [Mycoplasma putrefaciens]AEM68711.1 lipoprotein [Mycoplasma putrefaciens KS1]
MKLLNKLLAVTSIASVTIPSLLVVACSNVIEDNKPLSKEDVKNFINFIDSEEKLKQVADFHFINQFGQSKKLSETLPTEIQANPSSLKITLKDKRYNENILLSIESATTDRGATSNISNATGTVTVFIKFLNRKEAKTKTKKIILTGLSRNNGFNHHGSQEVDPTAAFGGENGIISYNAMSQEERFKYDNDKYVKVLESMYNQHGLNKNIDIKEKFGLNFSEVEKQEFDNLAKDVKFDSYYNAALKGFTLPVYEESNGKKEKKLKINDGPEVNKGPSFTDSLGTDHFKSNGLARTLINETYKTVAEQTFQVRFTYLKDFAEEIALSKKNIELIKSWDENQLKDFKNDQIKKLEYQYQLVIEQIQREIAFLATNDNGIKTNKQNLIKEKLTELEHKRNEIKSHTRESLIKLQEDEISKFEERKSKGEERSVESGTMWIMDYQLENNPTTFYFGTNSHVAKALTNKLTAVSITRIKESVKVGQKLMLNSFDKNFETFTFNIDDKNRGSVSAIFHATDFISKKPSDYLVKEQAKKYKDAGFFADFAVIEFDFKKLLSNDNLSVMSGREPLNNYKNQSVQELAKIITNNYANKENKQVKFKSDSYLTEYKKIDRPILIENEEEFNKLENLYILGYPTSEGDYYLKKYEDDTQIIEKKHDFSLWINADSKYFETVSKQEGFSGNYSESELSRGNFLSYQIGYRSFIDKPGLTDAFLAAHRVGSDLYTLADQDGKLKQYFNFGLELMPRFYAPAGGASGSSVRNKNNELIAVYHASNNSAKTGLATMLRSPGYKYNGLFGEYNLPQYDLIYGSGKEQINSYRHALENKYKSSGIKTRLFKDGFDKQNIPENFKFISNK